MVEITTAPPAKRLMLRGAPDIAARAGTAHAVALPLDPCRANAAGERAALWLGPDEWLLLAPADADAARLAAALDGLAHSLVDVSDGYEALLLQGAGAAVALSAGCPLDLHPAAFPPGMATRTVLGRIGITLWRRGPAEWWLEVARSQVGYAQALLAEGVRGMQGKQDVLF